MTRGNFNRRLALCLPRRQIHGAADDGSHVVISVFGQAAAEDDIFLLLGQLLVAGQEDGVPLVVDRIIRFHARFPLR